MIRVLHGDCRDVLKTLPADSFHSVVTDPPYHLTTNKAGGTGVASLNLNSPAGRSRIGTGFMGKAWDGGDIAFRPETWAEVIRVMKPGAFLAAFASTRGYHRMACAIEDAGFVIHPMLAWVFGSGFPKATRFKLPDMEGFRYGLQALKPALEPICLAQKPMVGTGNENWLEFGCGGLNIDVCRIGNEAVSTHSRGSNGAFPKRPGETSAEESGRLQDQRDGLDSSERIGRWPANLIHDGSDEVMAAFAAYGERSSGAWNGHRNTAKTKNTFGAYASGDEKAKAGDSGSAARFFYQAKADSDDRAGSKHPTVKPLDLIRWLSRLITPPGGHVLDLFAGSGTTGEAARLEGFDVTLIEREAEYIADINRRLGRASGADTPLFATT